MNLQEAANFLGRNADEVRKLAMQGIIPGWQVPERREWRFDEGELAEWAATNPKQSYTLNISDEELVRLCEGRTYIEVGAILGVTGEDVAYRMRRLGYRRYNKE